MGIRIGLLTAFATVVACAQAAYAQCPPFPRAPGTGISPSLIYPSPASAGVVPMSSSVLSNGTVVNGAVVNGGPVQGPAGCESCTGNYDTILDPYLDNHEKLETFGGCGFADTWYGGFGHSWWQFPKYCGPLAPIPSEAMYVVFANALAMRLETGTSATIIASSTDGEAIALNADTMQFDFQGGYEIGASFAPFQRLGVDVRYSALDGYESYRTLENEVAWHDVPFITPVVFGVTTDVEVKYQSELHSVELSGRYYVLPSVAILAGARYVSLADRLGIVTETNLGDQTSASDIRTTNDMIGFQLGYEGRVCRVGCLTLDVDAKAGIYNNSARSNVSVDGDLGIGSTAATSSKAAFLGEVGATAGIQLTRSLALRGGYQAIWVQGVAVAPSQIAISDPLGSGNSSISTDGSPMYHGGTLGFEYRR